MTTTGTIEIPLNRLCGDNRTFQGAFLQSIPYLLKSVYLVFELPVIRQGKWVNCIGHSLIDRIILSSSSATLTDSGASLQRDLDMGFLPCNARVYRLMINGGDPNIPPTQESRCYIPVCQLDLPIVLNTNEPMQLQFDGANVHDVVVPSNPAQRVTTELSNECLTWKHIGVRVYAYIVQGCWGDSWLQDKAKRRANANLMREIGWIQVCKWCGQIDTSNTESSNANCAKCEDVRVALRNWLISERRWIRMLVDIVLEYSCGEKRPKSWKDKLHRLLVARYTSA